MGIATIKELTLCDPDRVDRPRSQTTPPAWGYPLWPRETPWSNRRAGPGTARQADEPAASQTKHEEGGAANRARLNEASSEQKGRRRQAVTSRGMVSDRGSPGSSRTKEWSQGSSSRTSRRGAAPAPSPPTLTWGASAAACDPGAAAEAMARSSGRRHAPR